MQTKLTLRMEESLIEAAKEEAERRGTSLSRLVADVFRSLAAAGAPKSGAELDSNLEEDALRELGPRTRRLLGVLREADPDAYKKHLEEKYLD